VRHLSAAAIQVAVYENCGQTLDRTTAELLARVLTPRDAVERFQRQAKIARAGMSDDQLTEYRTYLVAKDAIEDASRAGRPGQSSDRDILDKLRVNQKTVSRIVSTQNELEQLSSQLERAGLRFRHFVRKADRLWRKQRSVLRAELYDAGAYEEAEMELAAIYAKAYVDANRESEVGPNLT